MNLFFRSKPKIPASTTILIDGAPVTVTVRVNARSRSYRLSLPQAGPVLTLPPGGKWSEAEAFLERQRHWLAARLTRQPSGASFSDGSLIPLRGIAHRIVGTGKLRGRVETGIDGQGHPALFVPGDAAHMARRLTDWLKAEAHADLVIRSAIHAERLGVSVKAIKMRSQASRWGSCSSTGTINYNWRLVMAPPHVLDYVAAHEVAHLVEMNHSPAFWAAVQRTLPDMERGRAWLKAHGRELMAHGG